MKSTFTIEAESANDLLLIADVATYLKGRTETAPRATGASPLLAEAFSGKSKAPTGDIYANVVAKDPAVSPQEAAEAVAALAAEGSRRKRRTKEEIARDEAANLEVMTNGGNPGVQAAVAEDDNLLSLLNAKDNPAPAAPIENTNVETYADWDKAKMWDYLKNNWNKRLTPANGSQFMRDILLKFNKPAMSQLDDAQMREALMELDRRAGSVD